MYLPFAARKAGQSCTWFGSVLCSSDVFPAIINSLVFSVKFLCK